MSIQVYYSEDKNPNKRGVNCIAIAIQPEDRTPYIFDTYKQRPDKLPLKMRRNKSLLLVRKDLAFRLFDFKPI